MRYKLHFTVKENGEHHRDSFVIEEPNIEAIRRSAKRVMKVRGLDSERNAMWSEEV